MSVFNADWPSELVCTRAATLPPPRPPQRAIGGWTFWIVLVYIYLYKKNSHAFKLFIYAAADKRFGARVCLVAREPWLYGICLIPSVLFKAAFYVILIKLVVTVTSLNILLRSLMESLLNAVFMQNEIWTNKKDIILCYSRTLCDNLRNRIAVEPKELDGGSW